MPWALPLGALHPAAGLGRGGLQVGPEGRLGHGQQRWGWHRQVVLRGLLVLVLQRRVLGLGWRLWRRVLRLERRLQLVGRGQRGVQWPLQAGLGVCGQEGLAGAGQKGLPRGDEGP